MSRHKVRLDGSSTTKAQEFFNNLWEHQQKNEYCDFTLITNGSPIECHKVVLSTASPYFRKLLLNKKGYKQQNSIDVSPTPLSVLNTAVAFMYNIDYNIEDAHVLDLLKLSVKWQLDSLSKECSQGTCTSDDITIENAVMFYSFIVSGVEFCDSTKVKSFICEHFTEFYEHGHMKKISLNNFCVLISNGNINVEREDVVFSAAMEIINEHTPEEDIDRCVGFIKFHHMSANFLLDVVQPHPVMLTQERCLLVREALRYQLTNQPSPSTTNGKRRAAHDIYYIVDDHIYRYKEDTIDLAARKIMRIPGVIDNNSSFAFYSNQLVVVSGLDVTLVNLTGRGSIEQLPTLPNKYQSLDSEVLLTADNIFLLGRFRKRKSTYHSVVVKCFVFHRSFSNKAWKDAQNVPCSAFSPLIVLHKQTIFVIGCINRRNHISAMYWYSTANDTWDECDNFDAVVNSRNAYVLVHDDAINVFTSTTRFKYIEESDTWDADHYQLEGNLMKVFVKGQHIQCVTRQTCEIPDLSQFSHGYEDDEFYDDNPYRYASPSGQPRQFITSQQPPKNTTKLRYYLQTYDVNTNQWNGKYKLNLGEKEPTFFF